MEKHPTPTRVLDYRIEARPPIREYESNISKPVENDSSMIPSGLVPCGNFRIAIFLRCLIPEDIYPIVPLPLDFNFTDVPF